MRLRTWTIVTASALLLGVGGSIARPYIEFYRLTGSWVALRHVERLKGPVQVTSWNAEGLLLADGRRVVIPGIQDLPANSAALSEITKRGIEVGADGRLFGLIRIWHWCGNDPVKEDIRRFDVSDFLAYMQVGTPGVPLKHKDLIEENPERRLHDTWGWNISATVSYHMWLSMRDDPE